MEGFGIGLAVACVVFTLMFVSIAIRLSRLERDIDREVKDRRELSDDVRQHYWDAIAAFRVLGLKKTPRVDPEWTKD